MVNATGARRSGWGRRAAVGALVLCAVADAALLAKYVSDDAVLEQAIELDRDLPPSQKVLAALDFIETRVAKGLTTDESFLPGLSFLRPTARQVLEKGGDCADRSRLLIELLKREGVSASKVALHDQDGIPRHAVVQAQVEDADGSMVVDALYGIYFPDEKGGYPTLRFMDGVGNARHGVRLPYNYWPRQQWRDAIAALGLTVGEWRARLRLYPPPASFFFDRTLHFAARFDVR